MKYDLTIKDLNAKQVAELLNRFDGETEISSVKNENVFAFKSEATNTGDVAVQMREAANSVLNNSTDELLKSNKPVERDSAGMPWDERIHSGSMKQNADGRWKLRKNVDENLVKQVEAENRPAMNSAEAPPAFLRREMPAAVQPVSAPVIVPATSAAPVNVPPPALPPIPPAAPKRDFSGLMLKISNLFATKAVTPDYPGTIVQRVNAAFGVQLSAVTDVANDPRMVEYSWQCLEVDGKAA